MRRLTLALVLLLTASVAQAKNLALVIGNDAYQSVPKLEKAGGDARAVSSTLAGLGYDVIADFDVTRRQMARDVAELLGRVEPGDTVLVYYAGHGVEIAGENYLLPVDITAPELGGEDFIKYESFALSALLDSLRGTGARATLVFLDACRNNPFAATGTRSVGQARGLGRVTAPEGTFVLFSAGAGQTALDALDDADADPNSIFTRLLLPKLRQQDLELREMVSQLRVEVRDLAKTRNHAQFPAYYDELLGNFYFDASLQAGGGGASAAPGDQDQIRRDFRLAMEIGTAEALEGFIARHGDSGDFSVDLAKRALEALRRDAGATPGRDTGTAPVEDAAAEPPKAEAPGAAGGGATIVRAPKPDAGQEAAKQAERDLVRQIQSELNRLGCSAGNADGFAGKRTRSAWDRYRAASGSTLGEGALKTEAALRELKATAAGVCAAAAPAPDAGANGRGAAPAPAPVGIDVTGTWQWTANCALVVRVTGWTSVTRRADGR